jgi:hypothetical protein
VSKTNQPSVEVVANYAMSPQRAGDPGTSGWFVRMKEDLVNYILDTNQADEHIDSGPKVCSGWYSLIVTD